MPERSCYGCIKQKEWGCNATKVKAEKGDKGAKPDGRGDWWLWTNPARLPLTFDGEQTYACPRQDLKRRGFAWHRMFLFYGMYKAGFLPQGGSVIDQSNRALEVFRIFDAVNAECDDALHADKTQKGRPDHEPVTKGRPKR
jgi:hypothetical protein